MKPRILLTGSASNINYINAVNGCGGVPYDFYLPEVSTDYDGLILCGGGDIHPAYYGEEVNGSHSIDVERDKVEFALVKAFVEAGKPILGICRGHQVLNVYFGGTMIQDLENAKEHASFADFDLAHPVRVEKGSVVEKLYGSTFATNSSHHQAINKLGNGLKVTMWSGAVAEGIAHETLPILGVQWHPERMCFEKKRSDTVDGSALIRYFIEMCK